jgi:hypothetical protein
VGARLGSFTKGDSLPNGRIESRSKLIEELSKFEGEIVRLTALCLQPDLAANYLGVKSATWRRLQASEP